MSLGNENILGLHNSKFCKACEYRKASVKLSSIFKTLKFVVFKLWVVNKKQFPVDCIMLVSKRNCSQAVFIGGNKTYLFLKRLD